MKGQLFMNNAVTRVVCFEHMFSPPRGDIYIYISIYTYREREGLQKHSKGRLLREKAVNKRMYIDILCYIHAFADTGAHSPKEAL